MRFDRRVLLALLAAATLGACFDEIPPGTLTGEREGAGAVAGTVTDQCDGTPLAGATLVIDGKVAKSDALGKYRVEGVAPGPQRATVTGSGYLDAEPEVVVTRGQVAALDVTLAPMPSLHQPGALDLLFVVDNSNSMAEEQSALAAAFGGFLEAVSESFSDIHVGVISSDLGAVSTIPSCEIAGGDRGKLQSTPRVAGCSAPSQPFIAIENGVATNVTGGDPLAAFQCIVKLGTGGCGFEQPLEAARLALEPTGVNPGFVRPDALLAVIVVSDEDDCSAADTMLFDTTQNTLADPLGPLTSFRCFDFGVRCDVNDRTQTGLRKGCVADTGGYLHDVKTRYVDFFSGLKGSADKLFFAVVAGPTDHVEVGLDGSKPVLRPSCQSVNGNAVPGIRLKTVVDQLNPRLSPKPYYSICEQTFPIKAIAQQLQGVGSLRSCN